MRAIVDVRERENTKLLEETEFLKRKIMERSQDEAFTIDQLHLTKLQLENLKKTYEKDITNMRPIIEQQVLICIYAYLN